MSFSAPLNALQLVKGLFLLFSIQFLADFAALLFVFSIPRPHLVGIYFVIYLLSNKSSISLAFSLVECVGIWWLSGTTVSQQILQFPICICYKLYRYNFMWTYDYVLLCMEYDKFTIIFLRKYHIVFHSSCSILCLYQ